ncbi:unnamed protein product, partial [Dovyalis caffra]
MNRQQLATIAESHPSPADLQQSYPYDKKFSYLEIQKSYDVSIDSRSATKAIRISYDSSNPQKSYD